MSYKTDIFQYLQPFKVVQKCYDIFFLNIASIHISILFQKVELSKF